MSGRYALRAGNGEGRTTTVHGRYQAVDSYCEDCEFFETKAEGLAYLVREAARHGRLIESGKVTLEQLAGSLRVYDVMARHGAPQLWDAAGQVLERRPK